MYVVRTRTETVRTEVTDLEGRAVVVGDGVDGEMGVDEAHLVLEALHEESARPPATPTRSGLKPKPPPTLVTPMIMFSTRDLTVRRQATCLRAPCQMVKTTLFCLAVLTWGGSAGFGIRRGFESGRRS